MHAQPRAGGGIPGRVRTDLTICTIDGTCYNAMIGVGEYYFPAFAVALGLGGVAAGLIATVPMLAAAVLQAVTPPLARRLGWYRTWVALGAAIQAVSFVPLVVGAWTGVMPAPVFFVIATMYQFGGMAGGPLWSTWIPLLVPVRLRSHYFAHRNRWCQTGILVGMLAGGGLLELCGDRPVRAFATLFAVAATFRAVSSVLLTRQSEPRPMPVVPRPVSTDELLARVRRRPDGRLLVYAFCATVAVYVAQPFFNPFMLTRFTETQYVILLATAFAGRIVAMPPVGRLARRRGAGAVLRAGAVGLVPSAGAWLVSDSFWWLTVAQFVGGAAWAAHELGIFLMNVEAFPQEERASVLAKFNLMNALAIASGSALGASLLGAMNERTGAYLAVFAASTIARAGALWLLPPTPGSPVHPLASAGHPTHLQHADAGSNTMRS